MNAYPVWSTAIEPLELVAAAIAVVTETSGHNDPDVVDALVEPLPEECASALVMLVQVLQWQHETYAPGALQRAGLHLARQRWMP